MSWLTDAVRVALGPAVIAGVLRALLAALLGALATDAGNLDPLLDGQPAQQSVLLGSCLSRPPTLP